jgi:hypothetical protein
MLYKIMNSEIYTQPFIELWTTVAVGLPRIVLALLVFIIGWIVAQLLYKVVAKVLTSLKIDEALASTGLAKLVERAGYRLNVGKFIGFLVKWFFVIAFLIISLDLLGLDSTKDLLTGIVSYIPQVILAAFVLFVGFIVADFTKKLVKSSTKMVNFKSAAMLGSIARIAIIVFTVLIVLNMLGIGQAIINTLFIGVVAMLALAGGLAFGLGGRDAAAKAIEDFKDSIHK